MISRHGFLSLLAKIGATAVALPYVPKEAVAKVIAPEPIIAAPERYVSWTIRNTPKFFDTILYTGTGVSQTIPNTLGDGKPRLVILKSRSKPSPWVVLDNVEEHATVPDEMNCAGEDYIAYEFGGQAVTTVRPYIDNLPK